MKSELEIQKHLTGKYLRELRQAVNLRPSTVAKTLGLPRNRVTNWEMGARVPRKYVRPLSLLYKIDPRVMNRVFYNLDLIKLKAKWGIIKNGALADYYKRRNKKQNNRPVKKSKAQNRK